MTNFFSIHPKQPTEANGRMTGFMGRGKSGQYIKKKFAASKTQKKKKTKLDSTYEILTPWPYIII